MSWIDQRPDDAMTGAFEAFAPEPIKTVEPDIFREAMSRLGAAVHVVTTAGAAGQAGFTATAVCSVSDAPPTLLVCLHRRSQSGPVLQANGIFSVNTLPAGTETVADAFAGRPVGGRSVPMEGRFAAAEWTSLSTGAPVLASAVVAFDCRVIDVKAVASHNVIFGAVVAVRFGPAAPALVYHRREYKRV
jgi:flavin reductase